MAALLVSPREALPQFLLDMASAPFEFGRWDCAMALANWVECVTGIDPASHLRGMYADDAQWLAIARAEGGLIPLVWRLAVAAGMQVVVEAQPGDIGVAVTSRSTEIDLTCGVRTEKGWAMKMARGLRVGHAEPLVQWGWRA